MAGATDILIADLSNGLRPVHRLAPPGVRAAAWLGFVAILALLLATQADLPAIGRRIASFADMWLSIVGSVSTMILATIAAVMLSLPDRAGRWALLPVPAFVFWLAASGWGCLRGGAITDTRVATWLDSLDSCVPFILKMSVVLAIPLAAVLWRARPLRPGLVAAMGGLAVASGSASLLWFFHPYDASAIDLILHAVTVVLVMLACRVLALSTDRWVGPRGRA